MGRERDLITSSAPWRSSISEMFRRAWRSGLRSENGTGDLRNCNYPRTIFAPCELRHLPARCLGGICGVLGNTVNGTILQQHGNTSQQEPLFPRRKLARNSRTLCCLLDFKTHWRTLKFISLSSQSPEVRGISNGRAKAAYGTGSRCNVDDINFLFSPYAHAERLSPRFHHHSFDRSVVWSVFQTQITLTGFGN
ncbi:hypothetical protein L218DRAFT_503530 [Marasmius fiardii PR-910]|nr:hypothetical protein L218DRAFT_503530 [Marasmius fiardii PR-910]